MPAVAEFAAILPAPFGALGVRLAGEWLTGLEFLPPGTRPSPAKTPLVARVAAQLDAYYADPRHPFTLPVRPLGSPFRLRVWQALQRIPAGETRSYGELARQLASAPRAVGQALGDNPLPIILPCHRVIAADGGLGGFDHGRAGYTLAIKRWLLQHEHAL